MTVARERLKDNIVLLPSAQGLAVNAQAVFPLESFSDTDGTDNNNTTMADHQQVRRCRSRTFSERKNILVIYNDAEIIKRYRLDSEGIGFVSNLMRDKLPKPH